MKTNRIVIKKSGSFYDVFHGNYGFNPQNWTRFIIINKAFLKQIGGVRMSKTDFTSVQTLLGCV